MSLREAQPIVITAGTIIKFFVIVAGIAAAYVVRDVIFALFFAIIIASAMKPAIEWFEARRIPRLAVVIGIFLAAAFLLFFIIYLVLPLLVDEFRGLESSYASIRERLVAGIEDADLPIASIFTENFEAFLKNSTNFLQGIGGGAAEFFSNIFGGLLTFVLIIVFSFYLMAQRQGIGDFLRLVTPVAYEEYALHLWERSQRKLGKWLRAQMLLGAIIGVLTFFGLFALGVPNAFLFAILAGIFELIPVAGPILAAVPAVITAFLIGIPLGVSTLVLYVVIQQIESHAIVPMVMSKSVSLSPIIVVVALLVGMKLGGIFGMLLAVPATAIVAELVSDWDKRKRAAAAQ